MKKDILIFLLGLFGITEMSIAGFRMPVSIVFVIPLCFYAYCHYPRTKQSNRVLLFVIIWMLGILLSSIYNDTNMSDTLKQVGKVGCLLIYFPMALWCLKDNPNRILWFIVGLGISGILQFFIFPVADFQLEVENSGFANAMDIVAAWFISPIIAAFCSVLYYKGYYKTTIVVACSYGIWAIINNSRHSLIEYWTFAFILYYLGNKAIYISAYNISKLKRKLIHIVAIVILGTLVSTYVYSYLAENNMLSEWSTQKYYHQKYANDLGLATGRMDFFIAAYAIVKSPIIGYGAKPIDRDGISRNFGNMINNKGLNWKLIPTHSHILGAWVVAGILGALFWILLLRIIYHYIKRVFVYNQRMWGFSVIFILFYLWEIFFSPYGGARGFRLAFIFSYFITLLNYSPSKLLQFTKK